MADGGLSNPNLAWRQNPTTGEWEQVGIGTTGLTPGALGADEGLFGLGTTNQWGTAMGLGGLAMKAIALPGQMDYYNTQTGLAKQQLASNKQAMADRNTFNTNWANASKNAWANTGNGLAASYKVV